MMTKEILHPTGKTTEKISMAGLDKLWSDTMKRNPLTPKRWNELWEQAYAKYLRDTYKADRRGGWSNGLQPLPSEIGHRKMTI